MALAEPYGPVIAAEQQEGVVPAESRDRGLDTLLNKTTVVCPTVLMQHGA